MGHQHINWLKQFCDEKTSSKERVRHSEIDGKSNESETNESSVNDVVISQKATVSWADVVQRGMYNPRAPASAVIPSSFDRLLE